MKLLRVGDYLIRCVLMRMRPNTAATKKPADAPVGGTRPGR